MKLFKPKNKTLILEPSISRARGTIAIPETYAEGTSSCKVIAVGNKVNPFIKEGSIVLCNNGFGERMNCIIEGTKQFMAYEHNVFALIKNRTIYSFGRTVIIKRHMREVQEGNVVAKLENRQYQSRHGTVVRLGLTRKPFRVNDIKPGDEIVLEDWQPHMVEIELEDRSYGLIVNETDILYKKLQ